MTKHEIKLISDEKTTDHFDDNYVCLLCRNNVKKLVPATRIQKKQIGGAVITQYLCDMHAERGLSWNRGMVRYHNHKPASLINHG